MPNRKSKPRQTFAEMAAELRAAPPKPEPRLSAGEIDDQGRLHDRHGARFDLEAEDLLPAAAARLVAEADAVVLDACGCGGHSGCSLEWLTDGQIEVLRRSASPAFDRRRGQVAWIDAWRGESGLLLYVHGNVGWAWTVE